jgi:hypothetical protein
MWRRRHLAALLVVANGSFAACNLKDGIGIATEPTAGDAGSGDAGAATDGQTANDSESTPASAYRDAVMQDGPLAYWRFEETSGPLATNETGGPSATYYGAVLGELGLFTGTRAVDLPTDAGARVEVPLSANEFSFEGSSPFTIELWVKARAFQQFNGLVACETTGPRRGWSIYADEMGRVSYQVWSAGEDGDSEAVVRGLVTSDRLVVGRFEHVVVTYDGSTAATYVNANKSTSSEPSSAPKGGALLLGARLADGAKPGSFLDGVLDEVAIYAKVVDEARIRTHHQMGLVGRGN